MSLTEYCITEKEREIVEQAKLGLSSRNIAAVVGCSKSTVNDTLKRVRNRAAIQGYSPDHDMTHAAPSSHVVKGISTLYDEDGQIKQQWVKTNLAQEAQFEAMKAAVEALVEGLPALPKSEYKHHASEDLMAVYPLGDPHIGMAAYKEVTGTEWNEAIAEQVFLGVFDRLVKTAPHCKRAVIVNLGDYFHADNVAGVTQRSGHHLDMDKDYMSMVKTGLRIMIRMIESAVEHHEHVEVITAIGNHDDCGAMFLMAALEQMYKDNDAITIQSNATPYHYVEHGQCMFGVHHGHTTKQERLPLVMATDQPDAWARTKFRYFYTGHIHHDTRKEHPGVICESFRTLAAKDAYATFGGYRAGQDSKALVLHKDYGEIERHTINIAQLTGQLCK